MSRQYGTGFEKGLEPKDAEFPPEAGLLESAEWCHWVMRRIVDEHAACLDLVCDAPSFGGHPLRSGSDRALQDAKQADAKLKAGKDCGVLHGVPIAVNDIYDNASIETPYHMELLIGNIPTQDPVAAQRFGRASRVLLGHLATAEFA